MKKFYPVYQPQIKGLLRFTNKPRRGLEGGFQKMSETVGLSAEYNRLGEALGEHAYIERNGMKTVVAAVQKIPKNTNPARYLFYGPDGIGKRTSMAASLEAAIEQKHVVFFIPNALSLRKVDSGKTAREKGDSRPRERIQRNYFDKHIKGIEHHQCKIDTLTEGEKLLEMLRICNSGNGILETTLTTKEYVFSDTIKIDQGTNLSKMIEEVGQRITVAIYLEFV